MKGCGAGSLVLQGFSSLRMGEVVMKSEFFILWTTFFDENVFRICENRLFMTNNRKMSA